MTQMTDEFEKRGERIRGRGRAFLRVGRLIAVAIILVGAGLVFLKLNLDAAYGLRTIFCSAKGLTQAARTLRPANMPRDESIWCRTA